MAVKVTEDFSSGTWDATKWAVHANGITPDVVSGLGRLLVPTGGTGGRYAFTQASQHPVGTSQEIKFRMFLGTQAAVHGGAFILSNGVYTSGGYYPTPSTGYRLQTSGGSSSLTLTRYVNGAATTIASNISRPGANVYFWVRLRGDASNSTLYVKTWLDGDAEPEAWTWSGVDVAYLTSSGKPGLWAYNGTTSSAGGPIYFDDIATDDLTLGSLPATVNATPATADATMVAASAVVDKDFSFIAVPATAALSAGTASVSAGTGPAIAAGTLTANADLVAPIVSIVTPNNTVNKLIVLNEDSPGGGTTANRDFLLLAASNGNDVYYKMDLTGLDLEGIDITRAILRFDAQDSNVRYDVHPLNSAFTEGETGTPVKGTAIFTNIDTVATKGTSNWNELDITDLVRQWVSGSRVNYGLSLSGKAQGTNTNVGSRTATAGSGYRKPAMVVSYYKAPDPIPVTISDTPGTASAISTTAVVNTGFGPSVAAGVGAAYAEMPGTGMVFDANLTTTVGTADATLVVPTFEATTDPNYTFTAPFLQGMAWMPQGSNFTKFLTVEATAATATVDGTNTSVASERGVTFRATAMQARAVGGRAFEEPSNINDPYYVRLESLIPGWYKMDEMGGTTAVYGNASGPVEAVTSDQGDGVYYGSPTFGHYGLEGRRVVRFDGVDDYMSFPDNNYGQRTWAGEITFKTSDPNGNLFHGTDFIVAPTDDGVGTVGSNFTTALDIVNGRLRMHIDGTGTAPIEFTGATRVDDDKWHHVVLIWIDGTANIVLDGVLHLRRHLQETQWAAGPDTALSGFAGDVMAIAFFKDLTIDDARKNYFAATGTNVITATAATATAASGTHRGKGNQKRALALYFQQQQISGSGTAGDEYDWTGLNDAEITNSLQFLWSPVQDILNYKTFLKSVRTGTGETYLSGQYYDEVTGDTRFIDLTRDIDVSEYDLVWFVDTPPEGVTPKFEALIENVRRAQDLHGFSIWAPQPIIAAQLGIISGVEVHSMMRESGTHPMQGNALTLYNRRAADIDPWKSHGDVDPGFFYYDNHALTKHRVVANVPNFTDLEGVEVEDYAYGRVRDPYEPPITLRKYKNLAGRGLAIGDELFYDNQELFDESRTGFSMSTVDMRKTVVSVRPDQLLAGFAITREQGGYWHGKGTDLTYRPNPWGENIVSIGVLPGDIVKGRPVNGKIFVNFMENFVHVGFGTSVQKQMVPAGLEPEEKAFWDYSGYRVARQSRGSTGSGDIAVGPGGLESIDGWTGIRVLNEYEIYPTLALTRYPFIHRAFIWLGERDVSLDGSANVRTAAFRATAQMVAPKVEMEQDAGIGVPAAQARAQMMAPDEVEMPDVEVGTLPLTAHARMTGSGKLIYVSPAVASAEVIPPAQTFVPPPDVVVLWLENPTATLYIKEAK